MTPSIVLFTVMVVTMATQCLAQAPGDADARCTVDHDRPPTYPDTVRNLMDSYHYVTLLPGNGTGNPPLEGAVWNDRSFDGNDVTDSVNPTYWQQGAGGICRFQTRVCGYRQGWQDNWLFTQHIHQDFDYDPNTYNYPVKIQIDLTYGTVSCRNRTGCKEYFFLHYYPTNDTEPPDTQGTGFMNTDNYEQFAVVHPPLTSRTYTHMFSFTLPSDLTGFYIGIRDNGTCVGVSRLRVYRNNCKAMQSGLVLYPDAPAPVSNSVTLNITCVDNAVVSGSAQVTCGSNGRWGSENPVCQCRLGYEDRTTECVACPAGQYHSADDTTCQQCPDNTVTDQVAAPLCECVDGYFRNNENLFTAQSVQSFLSPPTEPANTRCTQPPSAPLNVRLTPQQTSITVSWSPPDQTGGRSDLFYQVEHSDPDILGSYTGTVYLNGGTTSYTVTGLKPYTDYCVRVAAHNGVSDQNPDGTHLRTVEVCARTQEDIPGIVIDVVVYCCEVVVWDRPVEPNGVILNYDLEFVSSGLQPQTLTTSDDTTYFTIPSLAEDVDVFVKVRCRNGVGVGLYSQQIYIGGVPGNCNNTGPPPPPPPQPRPEPVCDISMQVQDGFLVWVKPSGRISEYIVNIADNKGFQLEKTTTDRFLPLLKTIQGNISVAVYSVLDGVRVPEERCSNSDCCTTEIYIKEPVTDISIQGDFLYWSASRRVSTYEIRIHDDKTVFENTTTEQFFPLPKDIVGNFSVKVCSIIDGVQADCYTAKLYREKEEPVCNISIQGDFLYWKAYGRISDYEISISDDKGVLVEETTTEQLFPLPKDVIGNVSVQVCSLVDGVRDSCCSAELNREVPTTKPQEPAISGNETMDSSCTEENSLSQELIIVAAACCGGTALLVGCSCLLIAAIHHWRFKKKFGPNKVAVTWDDYKIKD